VIDLSQTVSKNLLPQLVSSLRATNANVRDAGQRASTELIARCRTPEALQAIVENLIKALKDGIFNLAFKTNR
jgi:hypothetical protein